MKEVNDAVIRVLAASEAFERAEAYYHAAIDELESAKKAANEAIERQQKSARARARPARPRRARRGNGDGRQRPAATTSKEAAGKEAAKH